MRRTSSGPQIAIVGPCGSGKSTLAKQLQDRGYNARQITQEHSYVPDMWKILTNPDLLIFLEASFQTCSTRKPLDWLPHEHAEQLRRLSNAREHCNLYLETGDLSPEQVLVRVIEFLEVALERPPEV